MSEETQAREAICEAGLSLFSRALTFGSTGNISVRLPDGGWLMTPTNASLGKLDPAMLSKFDAEGRLVSGGKPTKEAFLHFCMYGQRADARAVVHLHSNSFGRGEPACRHRPEGRAAAAHRLFRHAGRAPAACALFSAG